MHVCFEILYQLTVFYTQEDLLEAHPAPKTNYIVNLTNFSTLDLTKTRQEPKTLS